ncbi:hypothetical protein JCM8547_006776 [Rhodosporidiobolus lusitaniae]
MKATKDVIVPSWVIHEDSTSKEDKGKTEAEKEDEDAEDDLDAASSPRAATYPTFHGHPLMHSEPQPPRKNKEEQKKLKQEEEANLRLTAFSRKALFVQLRLFAKTTSALENGEWRCIETVVKNKDSSLMYDSEKKQEYVEMKISRDKLGLITKTENKSNPDKPHRWLRLEITTIFNYEAPTHLHVCPSKADPRMSLYDALAVLLEAACPFYADLFASNMSEAITRHGKRPRLASPVFVASESAPLPASTMPPASPPSSSALPSTLTVPPPSAIPAPTSPASPSSSSDKTAPIPAEPATTSSASVAAPTSGGIDVEMSKVDSEEKLAVEADARQDESSDSDAALDALVVKETPDLLSAPDGSAEIEYRQITIPSSAVSWSTYHALLAYIQTDYVELGPLPSQLDAQGRTAATKSLCSMLANIDSRDFPLSISPRSLFLLAKILRMDDNGDDLLTRALSQYTQQLDIETICKELFSPVVLAHDELRKAAFGLCCEELERGGTST